MQSVASKKREGTWLANMNEKLALWLDEVRKKSQTEGTTPVTVREWRVYWLLIFGLGVKYDGV